MPARDLIVQVQVDDIVIPILPNSAMDNLGSGDVSAESFAVGNGKRVLVTGLDVSTQIGKVAFEMPNDSESLDNMESWGGGTLHVVQTIRSSGKVKTLNNAVLISSPDRTGGSDTNIAIEFNGDQLT